MKKEKNSDVKVGYIGAIAVILAAIIGGLFMYYKNENTNQQINTISNTKQDNSNQVAKDSAVINNNNAGRDINQTIIRDNSVKQVNSKNGNIQVGDGNVNK